jgi:hypothetical protein
MQLPGWLDFSFVAGGASILGLLLTVLGVAKVVQRFRARSSANGSPGGNLISTSAANTTGNVIVIGGDVRVSAGEFYRFMQAAETPMVCDARASGRSSAPVDEQLTPLVRDLEELLARQRSSISDVLVAAHRLAKHRDDRETMRWLECEMDGYSEADALSLSERTSYRRIEGYFLMAFGPAADKKFDTLPYPFFEAKSASRLEEAVRIGARSGNRTSITIPTPQSVRDFFKRHKPDAEIPPLLTLFFDLDELARVLREVRKRIRDYLRTLP